MLYLIPTIKNGYAEREFEGIEFCLNLEKEGFCKILYDEDLDKHQTSLIDFYIVADYYFNPSFKEENVSEKLHTFIKGLNGHQVAIYLSDPLFKFDNPEKFTNWKYFVFFGCSNYRSTDTFEYEDCKIWENVDIKTKLILDIPISELAFWSYIKMNGGKTTFKEVKHDYTISYIINSKILYRMKLLPYLDNIKCQLGNFPAIDNKDIQHFVEHNPDNLWMSQKVFGLDYLYSQNGKFTLVFDDDNPVSVAWPMRIYEAMAVGIIPLLYSRKCCNFIYAEFFNLMTCTFYNRSEMLGKMEYNSGKKFRSTLTEMKKLMKKYVYDYHRLYNKTIEAIEGRVV